MDPWEKYSAVEEGPWAKYAEPADTEPPSSLAVAGNAAAKGVAGLGDMFINAPVNAYNVAKAGAVLAGDAMGTDLRDTLEVTPQPNLLQKGFEQAGLIDPAREPQTPGQRILDMAVQSGVGMAVNPGAGALGVAKGLGLGLASGAAAGVTKEATGSDLAALAVGMAVPLVGGLAMRSKANAPILKNPTKLQTAQDGMAAGYVVPPSHLKPSFVNNRLESAGGKAAVKQQANTKNVQVTDRLVADELGLPPNEPLTQAAIQTAKAEANTVYDTIAKLSPRAKQALERLKETRLDASDNWMDYARSRRAEARKAAVAADAKAAQFERVIDREAKNAERGQLLYHGSNAAGADAIKAQGFLGGQDTYLTSVKADAEHFAKINGGEVFAVNKASMPSNSHSRGNWWEVKRDARIPLYDQAAPAQLSQRLKEARTQLAKIHHIQDAMNVGDGHVSASYLGHLLDNGKPLTGNLKLIGKFAQAFPDVMRDASRVPTAGVSALDVTMMLGLGTAGYFGKDDPSGLALGLLPLLRGPLRSGLLSRSTLKIPGTTGYQSLLLKEPPALNQAMLKSVLAGRAIAEAP